MRKQLDETLEESLDVLANTVMGMKYRHDRLALVLRRAVEWQSSKRECIPTWLPEAEHILAEVDES